MLSDRNVVFVFYKRDKGNIPKLVTIILRELNMKSKLILLCVMATLGASGCASTDKSTKIAKTQKQKSIDCPTTTGSRLKRSC
ncbi:MAG: hypothetical protein ACI9UT_001588 [Flavobacteriales bacterium]|jgi:hypothetical protein